MVLLHKLGADPLHIIKDGDDFECMFTLAAKLAERRGLAFAGLSTELLEAVSPLDISPKLEELIGAGISDADVSWVPLSTRNDSE